MGKKSEQKKKITPGAVCLIAALVLLYSPFFNMYTISNYTGDTMIQVRIGLDTLSQKHLILQDIYSWHEGLGWYPHETGWCILAGIAYKLLGVMGVIGLVAVIVYVIAGLSFKSDYKNGIHPFIILLNAAVARYLSFPSYIARPGIFSQLFIALFLFIVLSEKDIRIKSGSFVLFAFLISWIHGGMTPALFLIILIIILIEALFKAWKNCLWYLGSVIIGFCSSLLNPIGFGVWRYALMQSQGAEVWDMIEEWDPKIFSIPEMALILLLLIGFAVNDKIRRFDKNTIIKLAMFLMFLIASCKYCRFMNFVALMIIMFGAEQFSCLISWLNEHLFRIPEDTISIGRTSYYIISVFCAAFFAFNLITSLVRFFPTNSMSDISALAAYDEGVIDVIKDKGYKKIYNDFNSGTWLAFYGVPVHIDNRVDPYLSEFSGQDYIRGKMTINSVEGMNGFVDEYHPDAVVLEFPPDFAGYLIDEFEADGRYTLVYDNTLTSSYDDTTIRWLVFEVIY